MIAQSSKKTQNLQVIANENIQHDRILLIDDEGNNMGNKSLSEALQISSTAGLDLIQIKALNDVAICRIASIGNFLYKAKIKRKKFHTPIKQKEIKLSLFIGQNDLQVKVQRVHNFLEKKFTVKVTLPIYGRQKLQKQKGIDMVQQICNDLEPISVSSEIKVGHNFINVLMTPKKKP